MEERCADQVGAKVLEKYILVAELSEDAASMKRALRRVDKMLSIEQMFEEKQNDKRDIAQTGKKDIVELAKTMRRVWGLLVDDIGVHWGKGELERAMKTCGWLERLLRKYDEGWQGKESYLGFSHGKSRERVKYNPFSLGPRSNTTEAPNYEVEEHVSRARSRNFLN
jgi:hypothetical protein